MPSLKMDGTSRSSQKVLLKSFNGSYLECSVAHPGIAEVTPIIWTDLKTPARTEVAAWGHG